MLAKILNKERYYQAKHTPGLWTHKTQQISFTLVVDDFGVKYVNEEDVHHLENNLEAVYPCKSDWTGNWYVGVKLNWDYNKQTLRTSMPRYIKKALLQFGYKPKSERKQHAPAPYTAPNYGQKVQMTDLDLSPAFSENDKTRL